MEDRPYCKNSPQREKFPTYQNFENCKNCDLGRCFVAVRFHVHDFDSVESVDRAWQELSDRKQWLASFVRIHACTRFFANLEDLGDHR